MNNSIVPDGPQRFFCNEEYQARRRELWDMVAARFSVQIAEAGFLRRLFIRLLRYREFRRELRKITPSPESCWSALFVSHSPEKNSESRKRDA